MFAAGIAHASRVLVKPALSEVEEASRRNNLFRTVATSTE